MLSGAITQIEPIGNDNLPKRMDRQWWRDAVVYQIYARSFADNNGDGIGDIAGIKSKLDYLTELGVDAIWITPCYETPWNDGGYDVANYYEISNQVGSAAEITDLAIALHGRNIKLILDMVPNHTSNEHKWFQAALDSEPGSLEWQRYHIIKGKDNGEQPPNDWLSVFGGPAWSKFPGHPGYWYLHIFDSTQPDLNWENSEVKTEFINILKYWFDRGVDGFRIDVAHGLVKDAGYPDNNVYVAMVDGAENSQQSDFPQWDRPGVHEIYRAWRKIADEYSPAKVFCAEAWVNSPEKIAKYIRPDELHTAFNFTYYGAGWDAKKQRTAINESILTASSVSAPTTWVLSNHDVVRHLSRLAPVLNSEGGNSPGLRDQNLNLTAGLKIARAATLFMLGLPGSTYLYQGEELGLPEVFDIPDELREDPAFARSGGQDGFRDGCRVPIPWTIDADTNFGFSHSATARSWLPQPTNWAQYSVATQDLDPNSTLNFYRDVLKLRRNLENLGDGTMTWLSNADASYLAIKRGDIIIICNPSDSEIIVQLQHSAQLLIASSPDFRLSDQEISLGPNVSIWLQMK